MESKYEKMDLEAIEAYLNLKFKKFVQEFQSINKENDTSEVFLEYMFKTISEKPIVDKLLVLRGEDESGIENRLYIIFTTLLITVEFRLDRDFVVSAKEYDGYCYINLISEYLTERLAISLSTHHTPLRFECSISHTS